MSVILAKIVVKETALKNTELSSVSAVLYSWSVPWWCGGRSSGSAADSGHRGRSLPAEENQA